MPQGPDGKTIIIVKKVSGHGGHHGGSWKVAYADFVTSMMAFFMVLWLVSSASVQTRERIANYFRKPGVFVKGSGTPLELGGAGILPDTFAPPAESNSQVQPSKRMYEVDSDEGEKREVFGKGEGKGEAKEDLLQLQEEREKLKGGAGEKGGDKGLERGQQKQLEKAALEIQSILERDKNSVAGLLGQIQVSVDQRGLHLEIMDTPTASMFERGSASVLGEAEEQLHRIAKILVQLPNPIDIEGHTDAFPFRDATGKRYDNWNLSTDRANTARRILMSAGLKEEQVARVVGYASQRPKVSSDPFHPSNRRISISMRYTEQAAVTLRGTKATETRSVPLRQKPEEAPPPEPAKPTPKTDPNVLLPMHEGIAPIEPPAVVPPTAAQNSEKLEVEISTSMPEGEPIQESHSFPDEPPPRPSIIREDEIFGGSRSFEVK